jgi:hypothetical protein
VDSPLQSRRRQARQLFIICPTPSGWMKQGNTFFLFILMLTKKKSFFAKPNLSWSLKNQPVYIFHFSYENNNKSNLRNMFEEQHQLII